MTVKIIPVVSLSGVSAVETAVPSAVVVWVREATAVSEVILITALSLSKVIILGRANNLVSLLVDRACITAVKSLNDRVPKLTVEAVASIARAREAKGNGWLTPAPEALNMVPLLPPNSIPNLSIVP